MAQSPLLNPPATAASPSQPEADALAADLAPLEADDSDRDSAVSVDLPSVASLRSSIVAYQIENGRSYHAMSAGKYAFPNDDAELERLNIQHYAWVLTLRGELCLCPKKNGAKRVLDLGTGSGTWAIEYADQHPDAEVIGVDLSPVQPSLVPPNCVFEVDDLEKDWMWSKPFDFILGRVMSGSLSSYEDMIRKAYNALEPGGYLELQDLCLPHGCDDDTMPPQSDTYKLGQLFVEASTALGRPLNIASRCKEIMTSVGFVEVEERPFKWPLGTWPKEKHYKDLGYWCWANLDHGLEGLLMALLTRGLGWTPEQVYVFCARARAELSTNKVHAYVPIYVVYGKKPGSVPTTSSSSDNES